MEPGRRLWLQHSALGAALLALAPLPVLAQTKTAAPKPGPVMVVGDSLSAEYGIARGTGWVSLLARQLAPRLVVNASVSGDTTAGGLGRLPQALRQFRPSHVMLELGANDALRGLALDQTERNLREMIALCRAAQASVLLIGLQIPPNYGATYTRDFAALFPRIASSEKVPLVPFLLAGVADAPNARTLFQADGLHPTSAAQPRILQTVMGVAQPWLAR
ncbi:arylesterase [Amphibiibacter pelophylacis]|uniref:Arylesterase n=1 Tax=Amphibiibacter pelophylacis TaxID=1799477 RepID=A0ACC6NYN8_9BURK